MDRGSLRHSILALSCTLTFVASALSPASAQAGWTSGGGELIRDSQNPWFVQNTKDVSYCIEIDETNFGQTRAQVELIVSKAIENWQTEFNSSIPSHEVKDLQIATQKFHRSVCGPQTDLRFQFGVLSGEQIKNLDDPTRFLGVAVRTEYDRVQLRGKGFIYISPARGPLKFAGDQIVSEPWALENGGLLYFVLLHELGHVFGLPHSSERWNLMNERRVELELNEDRAADNAKRWTGFPKPIIFRLPDAQQVSSMMICLGPPSIPDSQAGNASPVKKQKAFNGSASLGSNPPATNFETFFGLLPAHSCQGYSFNRTQFDVYGKKSGETVSTLVGSATLAKFDGWFNNEPVMSLWLPKEQKVFSSTGQKLVSGVRRESVARYKRTYKSVDGKISRPMFIQATPSMTNIGGVMNGEVVIDILQGF